MNLKYAKYANLIQKVGVMFLCKTKYKKMKKL